MDKLKVGTHVENGIQKDTILYVQFYQNKDQRETSKKISKFEKEK